MSYGTPNWQDWVLDEEASLPILKVGGVLLIGHQISINVAHL